MKIYFDGCSWTKGEELENKKEERYSKLVCDELGAEEVNLARCGGSNDRIVRNLMIENNIQEYDYAVIQMTFPTRTEYLHEKDWIRVNPKQNYQKWIFSNSVKGKLLSLNGSLDRLSEKFQEHSEFWTTYYKNVMSEEYFHTKENIQMQTIRNHCKVNNVPLVLTSINKWTKQRFDLSLDKATLPIHTYGHPTKEGHRMIADKIVRMVK
tara:strand:- start:1409 stop:2035 length:627 start_codon:yes stop_codon:yes gene_type:complete